MKNPPVCRRIWRERLCRAQHGSASRSGRGHAPCRRVHTSTHASAQLVPVYGSCERTQSHTNVQCTSLRCCGHTGYIEDILAPKQHVAFWLWMRPSSVRRWGLRSLHLVSLPKPRYLHKRYELETPKHPEICSLLLPLSSKSGAVPE
eukprot:6465773-Amphidinium_carterae.2